PAELPPYSPNTLSISGAEITGNSRSPPATSAKSVACCHTNPSFVSWWLGWKQIERLPNNG
ncbi:MAG: hypothetical protein ACO24D_18955, partial [bacterium]